MQGDSWIIDGDYSRTYEMRIAACDTVIFLDYGEEVCMQGITERVGKVREDMPWTEDELDPELVEMVQQYETQNKPRLQELFRKYPEKEVITFYNRDDAMKWLISEYMIVPVDEDNIIEAACIHSISWQESHRAFCDEAFILKHDTDHQAEYIRNKIANGSKFYMLCDKQSISDKICKHILNCNANRVTINKKELISMEKTATLNLRVNPTTKKSAEDVLSRLGIPMSTAIDMYLRQITLTGGIPFRVTLPQAPEAINADLMTTAEIHTKLQEGFEDIEAGRVQDAKAAFAAFRENHR